MLEPIDLDTDAGAERAADQRGPADGAGPATAADASARTDAPADRDGAPGAARELEAKFELGAKAELARLVAAQDLPEGFVAGDQRIALIDDVYVDTAERDLLRAGFALRVRHASGGVKLTLKGLERGGLAAIHDRFELESQIIPGIPPLDPAGWSPVLRRWVLANTGPQPRFVPVVNVGHARLKRPILRAERPVAEWVVEELRVSRPDREGLRAGMPEVVGDFVEAELELLAEGRLEELERLTEHWLAQPGVSAQRQSKLEQALRMLAEHQPERPGAIGITAETSMPEAGRLILRRQLWEMLLCEGGARRGEDIEYVHDMRVACRRATGALSVFEGWFEPKALAPVTRLFKRTRRVLGPIRDRDVALERLARHQASLPKREARELEAVAERWRAERDAAYASFFDWLDSGKYHRLIAGAEAFVDRPGAGSRPLPQEPGQPWQLRHVLPSAILQRYAIVRSYEVRLSQPEPVPDAVLHQLRIDCKRLRYSLEIVAPLVGEEGPAMLKRLKRVQTLLGDFNDASVKRDMLAAMRAEGLDLPAVRDYEQAQGAIMAQVRGDFDPDWDELRGPETRELLGRALAQL